MQKLSISGPADLVTIIPFHLGFHPERSVVVICFEHNTMGLVARLDVVGGQAASLSASRFLEAVHREAPTSVALIGFEEVEAESRPLSAALGVALGLAGIPVREDLVVRDGRLYCLRDDGCPEVGQPLPKVEDVPAVAGYVAAGKGVLRDRKAMATLVAPRETVEGDEVATEIRRWRRSYLIARLAGLIGLLETDPVEADAWIDALEAGVDDGSNVASAILAALEAGDDSGGDTGGDTGRDDGRPDESGGVPGGRAESPEVTSAGSREGRGAGPRRRMSPELSDDLRAAVRAAREVGDDPLDWDLLTDEALDAWGAVLRGEVDDDGPQLEDLLPALVGALDDRQLRDALIAWITPGSMPLDVIDASLREGLELFLGAETRPTRPSATDEWGSDRAELLQDRVDRVCRATPREFAPPVLSVAASLAHWRGDGTRAGMCVDHALEIDPNHRLCGLIRLALDHGIRPQAA